MNEFVAYNKKQRIVIYQLAYKMFKGDEETDRICVGLCQFIAEAIIKLHGVNYYNMSDGYPITSPFHKTGIKKYWPELYKQKPKGCDLTYWWEDNKDREQAIKNILNNTK